MVDKLKDLEKGTAAWRLQLLQANQEIMDLKNKYSDYLEIYRNDDGLL